MNLPQTFEEFDMTMKDLQSRGVSRQDQEKFADIWKNKMQQQGKDPVQMYQEWKTTAPSTPQMGPELPGRVAADRDIDPKSLAPGEQESFKSAATEGPILPHDKAKEIGRDQDTTSRTVDLNNATPEYAEGQRRSQIISRLTTGKPGADQEAAQLERLSTEDLEKRVKGLESIDESVAGARQGYQGSFDRINAGETNVLQEIIPFVGEGAGVIADIGFQAVAELVKGGAEKLSEITPDSVEQPLIDAAKSAGQFLINSKIGQEGMKAIQMGMEDWNAYKEKYPTLARNIEGALNIIDGALTVGGLSQGAKLTARGTEKAVQTAVEQGGRLIDKTVETAENVMSRVRRTAKDSTDIVTTKVENFSNARLQKQVDKLEDYVGGVVQGKTKDLNSAKKALSEIDTEGVKTYADLNTRIDESLSVLKTKVDDVLEADGRIFKPDDLVSTVTEGGRSASTNYVQVALDQLEEMYSKISDPQRLLQIQNLKEKFGTSGLSLKEVNDVARRYGSEFGQKAFSKTGDPLTSVNAKSFENIRKGVKNTARDLLPDDTTKVLDEKMSDLLRTKTLVRKMEEKVLSLAQKVEEKNLVQRLAKGTADAFNTLTLGGPRQFLFTMMGLRNQGFKTLNALDLEERLPKLLKKIDKILKTESPSLIEKEVNGLLKATP